MTIQEFGCSCYPCKYLYIICLTRLPPLLLPWLDRSLEICTDSMRLGQWVTVPPTSTEAKMFPYFKHVTSTNPAHAPNILTGMCKYETFNAFITLKWDMFIPLLTIQLPTKYNAWELVNVMWSIWRGRDLLKDTVHSAAMYLLPWSMSCVGTCCGWCNLVYTPPVQPYVHTAMIYRCESIRIYLNLSSCSRRSSIVSLALIFTM